MGDYSKHNTNNVLNNVNRLIDLTERKRRAHNSYYLPKISAVYDDLSIFDWWKEELSLSDLNNMKKFLETAIELGYTGYVCFKVGVSGCANGMWAHTDESTTGYSPDCACIYRSFTPDYTNWSFSDKDGNFNGEFYDHYNNVKAMKKALADARANGRL